VLVASASASPASYRVMVKGQQTGLATLEQTMLPDGGKQVNLMLTIRQGENRVVVKTQTTYSKTGKVSHAEQRIYPYGKPAVKEVLVDIDAAAARVSGNENGESSEAQIPIQPGSQTSNPSAFWFVGITPQVGETCRTFVFNLDTLKWELCVITYEGKTHKGNLVMMERDGRTVETAYDDDGYPHSIEDSGGVVLERT